MDPCSVCVCVCLRRPHINPDAWECIGSSWVVWERHCPSLSFSVSFSPKRVVSSHVNTLPA